MSKTRCANTVPTSVAHAPLRPGIFRVSTATRASSPTRPGSRAFANRPTEKAENTSGTRGRGGSIAEWITNVQARARAITERRFSAIATATHSHCTALNALPIPSRLPRRHQNRPTSDARTTSPRKTRRMRLDGTRKSWLGSKSIRAIIVGGPVRLRSPHDREIVRLALPALGALAAEPLYILADTAIVGHLGRPQIAALGLAGTVLARSEEHTSELQSPCN